MKIYPVSAPDIGKKEAEYVQKAVKSGWVSSIGPYVQQFEEAFAKACQRKHALSVSNGTHALHLALCALNIQPGDEVIVPNFTFVATANAVTYVGATPVFVDCKQDTWNMDVEDIERAITKRTKAIIVVHLYGAPCEMKEILALAKKHKLFIVEDAAEAFGSTYHGAPCGSFGDISCFSFYANKVITTGEGGMCLTNSKKFADKMSLLRDHGMLPHKKYWHTEIAFNYRITNMQAALGCAQLERSGSFLKRKKVNAELYRKLLSNDPRFTFQKIAKDTQTNEWQFVVILPPSLSRDKVLNKLWEKKISCRPTFYPMSILPPYKKNPSSKRSLSISKKIAKQGICLPSGSTLTATDVRDIVKQFLSVCASV